MQHSDVYKEIIRQGRVLAPCDKDGYYFPLLDELYEWERAQVEELIWNNFADDTYEYKAYLYGFLPHLEFYDGVSELKRVLFDNTSDGYKYSTDMKIYYAASLYEALDDDFYIDIIKEFICIKEGSFPPVKGDVSSGLSSVLSLLGRLKPCKKIYNIFAIAYVELEYIRDAFTPPRESLNAILYYRGIRETELCRTGFSFLDYLLQGLEYESSTRFGRLAILRKVETGVFDAIKFYDAVVDMNGVPFRSVYAMHDYDRDFVVERHNLADNKYVISSGGL